MSDTITLPLTSIFTPPSSCSSQWTYEAEYYNSVSGGLLLQNALGGDGLAAACFPSGFADNGRIPSAQVFSPGACPNGYTTPVISIAGATTTGICCQTGFSYSTTYSTIDNFTGSQSLLFAGCVSTYASESGPTTVNARSGDSQLSSTTITGPVTMWGQAITIEFEQQDLSLFPSLTTTSLSPTSVMARPSTGPSTLPASTPAALATTLLSVKTTSPTMASAPAATTSATQGTVLSTGSQVGIGIGAAAALILALGIAAIWFRRRRKQNKFRNAPVEVSADQRPREKGSSPSAYQRVLVEAPDGITGPGELHGKHLSINSRDLGELPG